MKRYSESGHTNLERGKGKPFSPFIRIEYVAN
jgi:hypothetical protein